MEAYFLLSLYWLFYRSRPTFTIPHVNREIGVVFEFCQMYTIWWLKSSSNLFSYSWEGARGHKKRLTHHLPQHCDSLSWQSRLTKFSWQPWVSLPSNSRIFSFPSSYVRIFCPWCIWAIFLTQGRWLWKANVWQYSKTELEELYTERKCHKNDRNSWKSCQASPRKLCIFRNLLLVTHHFSMLTGYFSFFSFLTYFPCSGIILHGNWYLWEQSSSTS